MEIAQPLTIYYRGRLSGCNYDCGYCPFAKRTDSKVVLRQDKADLERFVAWVSGQKRDISVMFTPWGEAFIRRYYQDAMIRLSQCDHVQKVVIQTNLSGSLDHFLKNANQKLALWCTYHPSQTSLEDFVEKCEKLYQQKISFSVGGVGNRSELKQLEKLRAVLPKDIYMWVNANRDEQASYLTEDYKRFQSIDAWFDLNCHQYESYGKACDAGSRSLFIDGAGNVQRCHFVKQTLGNIYHGFHLDQSPCPNQTCDCHIGYIHLPHLALDKVFADRALERIPVHW